MDPIIKLVTVLGVAMASNALFIWIAAWLLIKDASGMNAARASVYQLLLWIPMVFALFILAIPVAADVNIPTSLNELNSYNTALLVIAFLTGMLGVKWSYERNLRASIFTYGLALALQIGAVILLLQQKPEVLEWLPTFEELKFFDD